MLIPKALFLGLMGADAAFRTCVLRAFRAPMADLTGVLDPVAATQADLAARIGTARKVVTPPLQTLASAGVIATTRGQVIIRDAPAPRKIYLQAL